jgi:cellulose synthase/poly-beta-1,6-N-acetylglucosamine synthase-like glycosyltransferase
MDRFLELFVFLILAVIVYTYAGYPLILFILSIFTRRHGPEASDDLPTVAMIISVHNEERIIRDKIENSLKLDYPRDSLKVIVASDGSIDETNDIAREYESLGVILKEFDSREGKSSTLNKAVLGVEEEILVFSDANAFYREDALKMLIKNFTDEEVGCVVGKLVYLDNESYVGKGESLYWRYEGLLNRLESRLRSVLVATGTIFAIRRELFRPVMKDVANDFQLVAEVASQGFGSVYEAEAIAYERSTYFFREEFSRKKRIIIRGLTGYNHLRHSFGGAFRSFQFISRKLLRWCVGAMLPPLYAATILLSDKPAFFVLFMLQNLFYLLAIVGAFLRRGRYRSRVFFIPFYFVMVNGASLFAILTYVTGGRLSSWEKAETTRSVEGQPARGTSFSVINGSRKASTTAEKFEQIT